MLEAMPIPQPNESLMLALEQLSEKGSKLVPTKY